MCFIISMARLKCNAVRGSDIIFSDTASHKIYKYIIQCDKLEVFAGSGEENCTDGLVTECSFRERSLFMRGGGMGENLKISIYFRIPPTKKNI